MNQIVWALIGPTASKKTQCALQLAQRFPVRVVSVDSAMVYRELDIGTAKPTPQEQDCVPHDLINLRNPGEIYSAGHFCQDAAQSIAASFAQNRTPLLVGGTMLYLHLLRSGFASIPPANLAIREQLEREACACGWLALYERLMQLDASCASRIHPNDHKRIQRALELHAITDCTPSALYVNQTWVSRSWTWRIVFLVPEDRLLLHQHIGMRFQQMLQQGLVEEVESVCQRHPNFLDQLHKRPMVNYTQVCRYLMGQSSFSEMQEQAIAATRQLAKRQLSWRHRLSDVICLNSQDVHLEHQLIQIFRTIS